MMPIVVLIGHPNVGKSTLFNRLTRTRDALVADTPRLTRDRKYGYAEIKGCSFIVIDTGSFNINEKGIFEQSIMKQSLLAIEEADVILFIVDARVGLIPADREIANYLRSINKLIYLVVNKIDGLDPSMAVLDFYTLGLGKIYPITASHGEGISILLEMALLPWLKRVPQQNIDEYDKYVYQYKKEEKFKRGTLNLIDLSIKLAVVGRPNVGKSTLINRFLEKERTVVYNMPGTTRDNIYIPIEHASNKYILIDTAGIRKNSNITESIEKFAVIKTLKAIKDSNVVILMIDALTGISDQDLSLINFIFNNGRSLVIVFNKWDQLSQGIKNDIKQSLNYRLSFLNFAKVHFVSALYGSKQSITNIFKSINETYNFSTKHINTAMLTRIMNTAINDHQPPIINGRRIKLKYAHPGGYNPPIIVIHGNQVKNLPSTYQRYLINHFRRSLNIIGTPIHLSFKEGENPYLDKRNLLTRTQQRKRKRLITYTKH